MHNAEVAHHEDPHWLSGLLAIAHEHSRWQLCCACFFATLVLDRDSPLIGGGLRPYQCLFRFGPLPSTATRSLSDRRANKRMKLTGAAILVLRGVKACRPRQLILIVRQRRAACIRCCSLNRPWRSSAKLGGTRTRHIRYEVMSGGFAWSDERLSQSATACMCMGAGRFAFLMGYRASLIRGSPREELRPPWDQLLRECPEWPGFRPDRRDSSALATELDRENPPG